MYYPEIVLIISLLKVNHPVAKCFERGWCKTPPDGRYVTVIKRSGNVVQLITHPHLASQRLHSTIQYPVY